MLVRKVEVIVEVIPLSIITNSFTSSFPVEIFCCLLEHYGHLNCVGSCLFNYRMMGLVNHYSICICVKNEAMGRKWIPPHSYRIYTCFLPIKLLELWELFGDKGDIFGGPVLLAPGPTSKRGSCRDFAPRRCTSCLHSCELLWSGFL